MKHPLLNTNTKRINLFGDWFFVGEKPQATSNNGPKRDLNNLPQAAEFRPDITKAPIDLSRLGQVETISFKDLHYQVIMGVEVDTALKTTIEKEINSQECCFVEETPGQWLITCENPSIVAQIVGIINRAMETDFRLPDREIGLDLVERIERNDFGWHDYLKKTGVTGCFTCEAELLPLQPGEPISTIGIVLVRPRPEQEAKAEEIRTTKPTPVLLPISDSRNNRL